MSFASRMLKITLAAALLSTSAACLGTDKEEPLQTKPQAEITELAHSYAQAAAEAAGTELVNWRTNTAPCEGRYGELAEDGRWNLAGFARLLVPRDQHLAVLQRIRAAWQQKGYEITEDRVFDENRGALSMRDPATRFSISVTSTRFDRFSLIISSACYQPVPGENPADIWQPS